MVFLAVGLALAACDGRDAVEGDVPPVAEARLTSEVLLEDDRLGQPQAISVVGDRLVVVDGHNDPAVHLIARSDGRRLQELGRRGAGPGEFTGARTIDPDPREPAAFWVFDGQLGRLTRYSPGPGETAAMDRSLLLRSDQLPMHPLWSGDTLLLVAGMFSGGRLARFDSLGRMRGAVGRIPGAEGAPPHVAQHAYTGTLVARPDRSRFALLTRHADRLELFGPEGEPLRTVTGPAGFEPIYSVRTTGGVPTMTSGDDLRFGYVSAAATQDAIYGLYSGRARGELPGYAFYGTWVHEYDWEGRLRRVFKLDAYVLGIAADPDGGTLYATRLYPSPAVLRIPLPQ